MNHWAVIPSRNRGVCLANLVSQLLASDVHVVVVDNGYERPWHHPHKNVHVIRHIEDPPNISRLWNLGLHRVASFEETEDYIVAVLNDDLEVPALFVQTLGYVIDRYDAAAAFPDVNMRGHDVVLRSPGPVPLSDRLTGFAFALRGRAGIFADETLAWWYGDDDIDWTARQRGGSVLVGGLQVRHLHPNETTVGVLAEQAGRDRQTFVTKWGKTPW